ncbi:hypothetical protein ACFQV2_38255 [Actinokineospora soli]|uniref:Uncharacterized protein n=1 Tax=Actinokineospora soli TaxID=1048753 RepID=A0ABW2TZL7_9PSEU
MTGSDTRPTSTPAQRPAPPRSWRPPSAPPRTHVEWMLLVAERAVGRLAPTLRAAMAMLLAAMAGIALVAVVAGLLAAVLSAVVLLVVAAVCR